MAYGTGKISIPAPPRGASNGQLSIGDMMKFQYQPLHEGLPMTVIRMCSLTKFQYQPLHEGLPGSRSCYLRLSISIPAPPRGASSASLQHPRCSIFQYQPLHEGLLKAGLWDVEPSDFNTSPSTRGFRIVDHVEERQEFQYQPLHEGLHGSCPHQWSI